MGLRGKTGEGLSPRVLREQLSMKIGSSVPGRDSRLCSNPVGHRTLSKYLEKHAGPGGTQWSRALTFKLQGSASRVRQGSTCRFKLELEPRAKVKVHFDDLRSCSVVI